MDERDASLPDEQSAPNRDVRPEGPPDDSDGSSVSLGRKLRLAGLVILLLVVAGAYYYVRTRERRAQEAEAQELADGISLLRDTIPQLTMDLARRELQSRLAEAGEILVRMEEIDPGNPEIAALTVPLLYRAGDVAQAIQTYNELGPGEGSADYRRASLALADFHLLIVDAARGEIGPEGHRYLASCALLWDVARRNTAGAATDAERALAISSWMAGNLAIADAEAVPVDPSVTCGRGYGSPVEMAWTFAELLRQAGVHSEVLVPRNEEEEQLTAYLVQVLPRNGDPLLVDTRRCVPVLDPQSGEPVTLESLVEEAELREQLAAEVGGETDALDYLQEAERKLAVHPYTCYRRFIAFDKLLSGLPDYPRIALNFEPIPPAEVPELWRAPVAITLFMMDERYPDMSAPELAPLDMMPQRDAQLRGAARSTLPEYEELIIRLRDQLMRADADEGIGTLRQALEMATFFEAGAVLDAGEPADAVVKLRRFLDERPESRFAAPAGVLLAEALEEAEGQEVARQAWQTVPVPRARYAELRMDGIIPWPVFPPAADAEAE